MTSVKSTPWARGPLELFRHAEGHLASGGDTDRRIALIGFDQTVETAIEVYVRLHPRLRDGRELQRDVVERALRSFHSKIEFLESHLGEDGRALSVPIEAIVWYHSLRNELYHSGNGMVPELHVVNGAREAALSVLAAVFGADLVAEFIPDADLTEEAAQATMLIAPDYLGLFFSMYRHLEVLLLDRLPKSDRGQRAGGLQGLWELFASRHEDFKALTPDIRAATHLRNRLAHEGLPPESHPEELGRGIEALRKVTEAISGRGA